MPRSWNVSASGGGKTLDLATAQPTYAAVATPSGGLDLEAVYVGLGSDADLALARDLKGKAAFVYSTDHVASCRRRRQRQPADWRARRVPTFTLGQRDGLAMRDLIGSLASGAAPRVTIRLDVDMVPNLKTSTVWGSLPGTIDEQVFVVAHRDGWFDGANDNASGVAAMAVLAEYFAKMTPAQRRRTITFLGTTGHHNTGANSGSYFAEHPEIFAKAALIINCEHMGAKATGHFNLRLVDTPASSSWYASGKTLGSIVVNALDAFGVPTAPESGARPGGEIGRYFQFAPSVQVMSGGFVWHSDQETPEAISTAGIDAVARAYAKIITDVNATDMKALRGASTQ
jgi:hypothetical protein